MEESEVVVELPAEVSTENASEGKKVGEPVVLETVSQGDAVVLETVSQGDAVVLETVSQGNAVVLENVSQGDAVVLETVGVQETYSDNQKVAEAQDATEKVEEKSATGSQLGEGAIEDVGEGQETHRSKESIATQKDKEAEEDQYEEIEEEYSEEIEEDGEVKVVVKKRLVRVLKSTPLVEDKPEKQDEEYDEEEVEEEYLEEEVDENGEVKIVSKKRTVKVRKKKIIHGDFIDVEEEYEEEEIDENGETKTVKKVRLVRIPKEEHHEEIEVEEVEEEYEEEEENESGEKVMITKKRIIKVPKMEITTSEIKVESKEEIKEESKAESKAESEGVIVEEVEEEEIEEEEEVEEEEEEELEEEEEKDMEEEEEVPEGEIKAKRRKKKVKKEKEEGGEDVEDKKKKRKRRRAKIKEDESKESTAEGEEEDESAKEKSKGEEEKEPSISSSQRRAEEEREAIIQQFEILTKLKGEYSVLRRKNFLLNSKLVQYFKKQKMDHVFADTKEDPDIEQQYYKKLLQFNEINIQHTEEKLKINTEWEAQRTINENLEDQVKHGWERLFGQKREIASKLMDPRTGRAVVQDKAVEDLIVRQEVKVKQLAECRLAQIKLRRRIESKKSERQLQNIGKDFNLMDYEKLASLKEYYMDKITERDIEIGEVSQKMAAMDQNLTTVKEQLRRVDEEMEHEQIRLQEISTDLNLKRANLNRLKAKRHETEKSTAKIKQQSGLLAYPLLLKDYDEKTQQLKELQAQTEALKKEHRYAVARIRKLREVINRKTDKKMSPSLTSLASSRSKLDPTSAL